MTSRVAVVTGLLVLVATVGFSASTLVGRQGFSTVLDGWLQPTAYVLCAALALLRPLLRRQDRLVWGLVAGALSARAVAFVLYLSLVRTQDPRPYPSVADAGWLLSCALLAAALLVLAASRSSRLPVTLVLDGAVGACAVGSLAWLVLPGVVAGSSPSGTPVAALVTNVLYPAADVALLLSVLGMLVASRWRAPPAVWVLGAGIVGFAVLDAWYLWELSQGTFRPATPLSGLSLVVTAVMAVSGWVPDRRRPGEPPAPSVSLYVPAALAATCLGLLVRAAFVPAPGGAVLLAAVGVAVTVVRTVLGFRDVRHLSVARQEARTDDLTGLANRRALSEALDRRLSGRTSPRPFALLVLDLDGFKSVNDTLGHHAGDELLVRVAGRLHVGMRPDDLVVRIGGDEFAVLLDDTEEDTASDVAVRLRQACRGPFTVGGRTITAEASVGIALFPQDGRTADLLLQSADNAMYAAKQEGTGQSLYRADFQQAGRDRLESKQELQRALAARELVVHYQPQVRLSDGAVIGLEALVRWQHPTRGLLAPPGFLPQAERTGLMRELTLDVLGQSLAQWRRWQQSGVLTTIAVNLSVSDLLDRSFPDQVAAALSRHGVPGSSLVLELTEDLLLADPRRGRAVIDELAQQGVRVQVDDYGTGYSTLGYLRDLPSLAGLKLDRSFVVGLLDDRRTRAIVESTVRLAADLGLELVAEGVETPAVRDLLRELGCPLAQGFLFGRPVPPQDVRFALEDRAPRPTASWRSPTRD